MVALSTARRPDRRRSPGAPGTLWMLLLLLASLAIPPRGFPAQPARRAAPGDAAAPRPQLDLAPTPATQPYALPERLAGRPELVGRRTMSSATYELGPGRYGMIVDQQPLHYEAAPGQWEPIRPVFETRETGWINAANTIQTGVAANRSAAKVWSGELGVAWEPQALAATDAGGRTATLAAPLGDERARLGQRSADGALVRYAASWSDLAVQDQWQVGRGESAYSLRLAERPQPRDIVPATLDLEVRLSLLPGTTIQVAGRPASLPLETSGPISFVDRAGRAIELAPPLAFEQADPLSRAAGTYVVSAGDGGSLRLLVRLPWAWFGAAGRQYPVIIDPVFQMRNGTTIRSPGYWPNYDNHRGDYGPAIGRYRDGAQDVQQIYLVKFALPTLPRETTSFFPVPPTISAATLVATPVDGGTAKDTWAGLNIQARALNSGTWTDFGTKPLTTDLQGSNLSPEWQPIGYSAGNPENPTSAAWDVTSLVAAWVSNPAINNGIALFSSTGFCTKINPNGCAGLRFSGDRNWIDADLARVQNSSNPHQLFPSPNKTGGVRLVVEYAAPELRLDAPIQDIASPTNSAPHYRNEHTYRLDPAIADPWVAVATRSLRPTAPLPPPTPPDGQIRTRTDTDRPVPFEVKHTQGSFNTLSRPIDGHNVQFIGLKNSFIQNNGTLIVSPSNALPANYQLDVIPQRGAVAGVAQNVGATASFTTFTLEDDEMFNFWDLSLPSEPNVNTRVDLRITPEYASDTGKTGTPAITVPDAELLARFRASLNEISFVGQTFRGDGRADNPSPDNRMHSFELGPAAANTEYKLGLSYDGPQVVSTACVIESGEVCTIKYVRLRFSVGVRITSCRPTAGGDATYPTSQGTCQIVACPTSADNFHGNGAFGVWGAATLAGSTWTTTDGDTAPLVGINNNAKLPTVAAVGGRITLDGAGDVTIDATAGTPSIKLIDCGEFANPNTLDSAHTFQLFNRPVSSVGAALRPAALPSTPWFDIWNSAADIVPASRSSAIDVAGGRLVNSAQFSLAAGNADESAPLSPVGSWSVGVTGWSGLETALGGLAALNAKVASMTLTGGPDYGFDVQPSMGKDTPRWLTALRINTATITHKAELGGASKPVKALIFPRGTPVPGASTNRCEAAPEAPLNCIDLRAPSDTPSAPNRIWAMPDIHLELNPGALVLQKPGEVRAFSTDHPMAGPDDISQNFSYDTFGASVSVTQEECAGKVVTVIRGETRLTLPNVGDGTSPDGVIAASFKLCGGALRQVHMEFKSPAGIPIGSTGFFLTGLSGTVDIMPDYTQIKFGIDFQAAQGGDGGLVKAHGEVTIDTRGLIGFSGQAKILSAIDAEGKVWVAWNPLDIGFDTQLSYGGWLTAGSRGHLWKGQGWQNRYSWLPDNDETHLAAELDATITVGKGDILETFVLDIPPGKVNIKLSLAFGQFCTNGGCTSYEWGIKGKFEILGYNVGLYYGFNKGLDFILGNDDHVLIDQYGGAATSPILRDGQPFRHRRAARAIAGTASETFAVSPDSQEALLALGWRTGTPTLRLINPAGESRTITLDNGNAWAAYGLQSSYAASATDTRQQLMISLDRPASGAWAGDWTLEIGGLSDAPFVENYQLLALTNKGEPGQAPASDYRFTAPAAADEPASPDGRYTIRWNVPPAMTEAPSATISLFYTFAAAITGTVGVSVPIRANLPFSAGQYEWDLRGLAAGSYSIFAQLDDGFNDLGDGSRLGRPDDTCQPQATWVPPARAFDARRFPGVTEFAALGSITLADSAAPPVPTGLSLTPTAGALLARWNGPAAADRDTAAYNVTWGVYASLANTFTPLHNQRVTASHTPTLRLGALTTLANPLLFTYAARVEAIDSTGNTSAPSAFAFGHPMPDGAGVPFQPLNLSRVAGTQSSVTLRWDENPAGPKASAYQITASRVLTSGLANPASFITLVAPDPAPASYNSGLEATLGGLEAGAVYSVTVTARDAAGWNSAAAILAASFIATNGADGDGDGLPDDWAAAYGIGGDSDSDGDGLSNAAEFVARTNPARQDGDGDGFSDYEELTQAGANDTDPRNSLSYPAQQLQPRLQLDQRRVTFRINKGDAPQTASLTWQNPVAGTSLILRTSQDAAWLDSAANSGGLSGTIQLAADASQLAPGFYSAVVRVDAGAGSDPLIGGAQCVLVNLFVSSPLGGFKAYLPRLDRAAPQADLRGAISLTPSKLSWQAGEPVQINVTITNHGTAPTAPFWADLYINPAAPPSAANQPWYDRCGLTPCFGMAWQVGAPIPPGGSVTLTSTAGSASAGHTIWPGWFANGTSDLYLYVDSWNPGVAAGAIAEPNEADNLVALHGLSVSGTNPALAEQPDLGRIQPR